MNFKYALMVLQLVPSIITAVMAVESAIPLSGQGRAKLELIKTFIGTVCDIVEDVWPAIEKIIAAFVSVANATGIFKSAGDVK